MSCNARLWWCAGGVFVLTFAVLVCGINENGIAATYLDPVAHLRTQDESLQVNSAIRMAREGGWLTPEVMNRYFLFKPPLLVWISALSTRTFGLSLFAVRLPALLAGAAGVAAIFLWCARARSMATGVLAAGFLLFSPFWQTFSRVDLTDVPASALAALALSVVALDPRFEKRRTSIAFGVFGGASILTKSVAGVLPFAAFALFYVVSRREGRPRLGRVVVGVVTAMVVVLPWHLYQTLVHPLWFWADYIQVQLLGVGMHSQANSYFARSPVFYLDRMARMDPLCGLFALAGIAGSFRLAKLRNQPAALLGFCWLLVTVAALCVFQAKHMPYLVFLVPSLCVVGALSGPSVLSGRVVAPCLILVLACVKVLGAGQVWSLRPTAPPLQSATELRIYCGLHRAAELISVEPDDEFYSLTLPLPGVRFCFLDPSGAISRAIPHYVPLGIVLDAEQFVQMPLLLPRFRDRLRAWGLDSVKPVGSAIVLHTPAQINDVIRASPASDFYLPQAWESTVVGSFDTHKLVRYSTRRFFLLSRAAGLRKEQMAPIPLHW